MLTSYTFHYHSNNRSQTMPIIGALVYMSDINKYGQITDINHNNQTYTIGVMEEDEFMHGRHPEFDDCYDIEHRFANKFDICVGYRFVNDFDICVGVDEDGHYYWANGRTVEERQQLDEQEQQLAEQK